MWGGGGRVEQGGSGGISQDHVGVCGGGVEGAGGEGIAHLPRWGSGGQEGRPGWLGRGKGEEAEMTSYHYN